MWTQKMTIKIERIRTEASGDWHDKPLKWAAIGPDVELQKFSTKASAVLYARIRRKVESFADAAREFAATH